MSNQVHNILESFSFELWQEIFDYLNVNDLWYSFHGLNRKINAIINKTILYLNFKKQGSYSYFKKHIMRSINLTNVRSLRFENSNESEHFFSKYSLNSLIQLRLLSLKIYSFNDDSFTFWKQLSSLKYLQSLNIKFRHDSKGSNNCVEEKKFIIYSIFNKNFCPSLKSFMINTGGLQKGLPTIPSLVQTTNITNIKYLSIDILIFNDLIKLFPALQNIKSLRIDYKLYYDYLKSIKQDYQDMTITMPSMFKCIQLDLELSNDITFEHIEYILKHTPNLKDLFLWGWFHLLDAKKWELLLSIACPKIVKFKLICTGYDGDDNFYQASDDFEQECQTNSFWIKRNVTVTDEDCSGHDYRSDIVVRFNIEKSKQ